MEKQYILNAFCSQIADHAEFQSFIRPLERIFPELSDPSFPPPSLASVSATWGLRFLINISMHFLPQALSSGSPG